MTRKINDLARKKAVGLLFLFSVNFCCLYTVVHAIQTGVITFYPGRNYNPVAFFVKAGKYSIKSAPDVFYLSLYYYIVLLAVFVFVTFLVIKDMKSGSKSS